MEKIDSVLKFNNYLVNNVTYKRNLDYNNKNFNNDLTVNIFNNITINGNNMEVNLITKIFENSKEKNYPFEMIVDISGFFEAKNPENFKANAIAILYPYIRAIVSTYTAVSNISPLILPPINVNAMLKNNEK